MSLPMLKLDCRGQQCPAPILSTTRAAKSLAPHGGLLHVISDDDAFPKDIETWCRSTNAELVKVERGADAYQATLSIPASLGARTSEAARPAEPAPRHDDASELARLHPRPSLELVASRPADAFEAPRGEIVELDCRGLVCPAPIVRLAKAARGLAPGRRLRVLADDPAFAGDLASWCETSGFRLLGTVTRDPGGGDVAIVEAPLGVAAPAQTPTAPPMPSSAGGPAAGAVDLRGTTGAARLQALQQHVARAPGASVELVVDDLAFMQEVAAYCGLTGHTLSRMESRADGVFMTLALAPRVAPAPAAPTLAPPTVPAAAPASAPIVAADPRRNLCSILILHNDLEALLAAMLVTNGALAQGMEVNVFFSFWGLNLLRGDKPRLDVPAKKISWMQKMMKWMMPKGPKRQKLGQMNFAGAGPAMLGHIMKQNNIMDLPALMEAAREGGARFIACTMSMSVMGITPRDLMPLDNLELGGVASFVGDSSQAKMTMVF